MVAYKLDITRIPVVEASWKLQEGMQVWWLEKSYK